MPLVSVIVPVYNAGPHLAACLDSLLAQTLTDIELIVVDDASTDGSPAILADYARRDARIRLLTQGENLGVSPARNRGLEAARGDYIGFCDADDWAAPTLYGALYEAARANRAQLCFCAVYKHLGENEVYVPLPWPDGTVFEGQGIRETVIPDMIALSPETEELPVSGYTPRTLFLRETLANLRFDPAIRYAEDLLFIVEALLRADRLAIVSEALYHYRFHDASATKRYSPNLAASQEACMARLTQAFRAAGLLPALGDRMAMRGRRNAQEQVLNLSRPDAPLTFRQRVRALGSLFSRQDVRQAFAPLRLGALPRRLAFKYSLIKHRRALFAAIVYGARSARQRSSP